MKVDHCPGCGHTEGRLVGNPGTLSCLGRAGELFCQPDYRIRCCARCNLYYRTVVLAPETMERYYQTVDFWQWDDGALFPTECIIYNFLQQIPRESKVLDFGCSIGRLLTTLTDRHECYGVEINQEAAQVARSRGITMLSNEQWRAQHFGVIVLHDVFEHLYQPTALLEQLVQQLEPNGYLIVATGNADAQACRPDLANYWYFRYFEHLCMMSQQHARFLAKHLQMHVAFWQESRHYVLPQREILRQQLEHFAYWQFRQKPHSPLTMFMRHLPHVKNAAGWPGPRLFKGAKDHVVLGLRAL